MRSIRRLLIGAALIFVPCVSNSTHPELLMVIDIRPGGDVNPINPMSRGVIPVAILGTDTFDVFDVDHIYDVNVHGLGHYLIHPLVHAPILRAVAGHRFSRADADTAAKRVQQDGDFAKWGPKYRDEDFQEKVIALLEAVKVRGSVKELVQLFGPVRALIDDVRGGLDA